MTLKIDPNIPRWKMKKRRKLFRADSNKTDRINKAAAQDLAPALQVPVLVQALAVGIKMVHFFVENLIYINFNY